MRNWRDRPAAPKISETDARASYEKELLEFEARLRAQKAEKASAGITAAEALLDTIYEKHAAIEDRIDELPMTTPNVAAARILIDTASEAEQKRPFSESFERCGTMLALVYLRPLLTGLLRAHVDEILDNPCPSACSRPSQPKKKPSHQQSSAVSLVWLVCPDRGSGICLRERRARL